MSEERKKAQPKPVVKAEPKKRVEPKPVNKVEAKKRPEPKVIEEVKPVLEVKKKAEPKPIVKQVPQAKKKTEPKPVVKPVVKPVPQAKKNIEPIIDPKIELYIPEKVEGKIKRSEDKYVRIALDAKVEEKNEFGVKVRSGELKYMYYAIDNDKGYHYYLVLKK